MGTRTKFGLLARAEHMLMELAENRHPSISTLFGRTDLSLILQKYRPARILHVGGHLAQEAELYEKNGAAKVVWIEAIPAVAQAASAKVRRDIHTVLCGLALDCPGLSMEFHLSANDMLSSSVFSWGETMKRFAPMVHEKSTITLVSTTVDLLLKENALTGEKWDLVVLDVQGAELLCLKGMTDTIRTTKMVLTEYSTIPLYHGGALLHEIDQHLRSLGFAPNPVIRHAIHGDLLYRRRGRARWL